MFEIKGCAVFSEDDMALGEKLEETLKNEGFAVQKEYVLQSPAKLVLKFGVSNEDTHKSDTEFKMN